METEIEKLLKKYRHRIPLASEEIQLLIFALRDYGNRELKEEANKLLVRLEAYLEK